MVPLNEEESKAVQQLCLLTMKPVIFAANVAEAELADASGNPHVDKVKKCAAALNAEVVVVSAQVNLLFQIRHTSTLAEKYKSPLRKLNS
jgi:ribosome-binding ATPase YchF (GTP1/OBG family)